jgi:hypothetical protein
VLRPWGSGFSLKEARSFGLIVTTPPRAIAIGAPTTVKLRELRSMAEERAEYVATSAVRDQERAERRSCDPFVGDSD